MKQLVHLGLGTNLGNKRKNLLNAIVALSNQCGEVIKTSSIYESKPWGFESDEQFYNMVIAIKTNLKPLQLLQNCQLIEKNIGRKPKSSSNYESRIIDIDILYIDDVVINDQNLTIPHPHIEERLFVLKPLLEIFSKNIQKVNILKKKLEKLEKIDNIEKIDNSDLFR